MITDEVRAGSFPTISDNIQARALILASEVPAIPRSFRGVKESQIEVLNRRKRVFDLFWCFMGLPFMFILFPIIVIAIKCCSKGPVFFRQEREGQNGETFICYKFRTMETRKKTAAPEDKPHVTQKEDKRVHMVGKYLRKSNLDELPQLINVMKGDMSLVGPRPYMTSESTYWSEVFDEFSKRRKVKPGISGLAQVNGYRGGTLDREHMETRLQYDLLYIESYTVEVDMMIIWKTILFMLKLDTGAH